MKTKSDEFFKVKFKSRLSDAKNVGKNGVFVIGSLVINTVGKSKMYMKYKAFNKVGEKILQIDEGANVEGVGKLQYNQYNDKKFIEIVIDEIEEITETEPETEEQEENSTDDDYIETETPF